MSKALKSMLSNYLLERYGETESACVVDLSGMSVAATEDLRATLREKQARLEVVRNRLARYALADRPLQPLAEALSGPSALVTSEESIIDVAKTLVEFKKKNKAYPLTFKEAMIDGDPNLLSVEQLASMKSRVELLGDVAGCIGGPGRLLAGAIGGAQGRIAGCIKTIADKAA
jgi:large subunit ribosomal protein L10